MGALHWLVATLAHAGAGIGAVLVYVLLTRAHQERRPPSSAIAWVLSLALLPWIALPLYLLLGRRKARRLHAVATDAADAPDRPSPARMACAFGIPGPHRAQVRFDADGAQALANVLALFDGATGTLDVAVFILGGASDPVAARCLDALAAAAARGVRVRLLLDGLASRRVDLAPIRARGIEARFFRPPLGRSDGTPRNLRNHRKVAIADGVRAWSGGRNLAREYFEDAPGAPAWLDLSFRVDGALAQDAQRLFAHDWNDVGGDAFAGAPRSEVADADGLAQWLPSGPDMPEDCAHAVLVDACYRAGASIAAVTPYFVPDDALLQALRLAAIRGVRVDLVVPAASNHRLADIARARALRDLASVGARIHLLPRMVHAKAFVADDALGVCGSTNLDPRSLFLNHELSLMCFDRPSIAWLRDWIEARIATSRPYVPDRPGVLRDLGEGLVRSVGFQL